MRGRRKPKKTKVVRCVCKEDPESMRIVEERRDGSRVLQCIECGETRYETPFTPRGSR